MDKEEILSRIEEIGTCDDDVTRRTLLTEIRESVSEVFDSNVDLTEKNSKLTTENERILGENMKLFLRVGEIREPDKPHVEQPKEKRSFENLFDEKGGIK